MNHVDNRSPIRAIALGVCLLLTMLAPASTARGDDLQGVLEGILEAASIEDARIGVHIIDARQDRVLASVDAESLYLPASNMKLLSSGTAIAVLGADFVFETRLALDPVDDASADLWLIGDGDPALADPAVLIRMDPALDIEAFLGILGDRAADALDGRALRSLVVDDRVFDREFVPPSWPIEKLNMSYAAEVGGINIHANVLRVFPSPAETVSGPPVLSIQPESPWTVFENRARTIRSGQHSAWIARPRPENRFTVFGSVPQGRSIGVEVALHDPPMFAGRLVARAVAARGVEVAPPASPNPDADDALANARSEALARVLETVRRAGETEQAADPVDIAVIRTPITDVAARCNKASENLYAEALLKRAGHAVTNEPGSIQNGTAVTRMVMRDLIGPDAASRVQIGDGSGLSRQNMISPQIMTRWLSAIARRPDIGDAFYASLPMPGEERTTLRTRFGSLDLGTEVRAKSGTINGVRCLSGYVRSRDGTELVAFSILVNDLKRTDYRAALRLHEQIVDAIDDYVQETVALNASMPGG